jgi:hypothetical protein
MKIYHPIYSHFSRTYAIISVLKIQVFWGKILCEVTVIPCFKAHSAFILIGQAVPDTIFLWNSTHHLCNDTVSHPRRPEFAATMLWVPQILEFKCVFGKYHIEICDKKIWLSVSGLMLHWMVRHDKSYWSVQSCCRASHAAHGSLTVDDSIGSIPFCFAI